MNGLNQWDDRPWRTRARDWVLSWLSTGLEINLGPLFFMFRVRHYMTRRMVVQWFALMAGYSMRQTGFVMEQDDRDRVNAVLHCRGYLLGHMRETYIRLGKRT